MKQFGYFVTLTITVGQLVSSTPAQASGGYSSRVSIPPPSVERSSIDREKYNLGQKVFAGKVTGQGEVSLQKVQLGALQSLLPPKVAKEKDLPTLAGKLSATQLDALDYFLNHRYAKAK